MVLFLKIHDLNKPKTSPKQKDPYDGTGLFYGHELVEMATTDYLTQVFDLFLYFIK